VGEVFDCSINGAGEEDSYSFNAQQNDSWYFRVLRTAGAIEPLIRVANSNGDTVAGCSRSTFGGQLELACNITISGAYTFRVSDRDSNSGRTGTYLVYGQHLNSPANSTPIAFGTETNAALQYTIEDDVYRFNATINDKISIRVRRSAGTMQPSMYIYDSAGNLFCWGTSYSDYIGRDCTATKTDTYFVFVGDISNQNTGSYTLHLQRRNSPGNTVALAYGVPHNGSISVKSEMDTYTFTAAANDQTFLRVKANSGNLQPALYVYDQAGTSVCGRNTYGTFVAFDCPIAQAGVYNVIMDDTTVAGTGDYTLYLQRTRNPGNAARLPFGKTVNGAIEALGAFDSYTFEARKNDKINLSLARTAGSMTFSVGVYDPNGEELCSRTSYSTTLDLSNCAITTSGTHSLFVFDPGDDAVGAYTLALGCATGVCGSSLGLYIPVVRR
jgi:hypothetical protein